MDIDISTDTAVCTNCNHWHQLFIDGAIDEITGSCDFHGGWRFRLEDCDHFIPAGETVPPRVVIHTAEYIAAQAKTSTRQIKAETKRLNKPYYKSHKTKEQKWQQ